MNATGTITPETERRDKGLVGDVMGLIDQATGAVAATYTCRACTYGAYTYSAFGQCTATGSQADVCGFRFGGMYWQANAGCYYDKALSAFDYLHHSVVAYFANQTAASLLPAGP